MKVFWLFPGDPAVVFNAALIAPNEDGLTARVLVVRGATQRIDEQAMVIEHARDLYRDLLQAGWTVSDPGTWTERRLRVLAYD